ncbi:MAG: 3-hydroxyacyl-CoA dehydrogenase NAD-binding domain-containing protein [Myxococcota bacterium]|jgi:carnitine 3-dehydrogenase
MHMPLVKQAAVIGCGVIGAGWVARLIENGVHVRAFDPADDVSSKLDAVLLNSRHAYQELTNAPRHEEGQVEIASSVAEAVRDAGVIIEAVPERLDVKRAAYEEIEASALSDAIVASSTSGIMPSILQEQMRNPERFLVTHPFNPVYLIPLVELVAGKQTDPQTIERARLLFDSFGMHPLHVRKEIEGFIADRLLEAVWREALWLVNDGIATTGEIDDAVRFGFGLRYAQMGIFDTYRMAGGEAGMRHFIAQFGPCLKWPWTKLMDVPELTPELIDLIADQSDDQSGHLTHAEMERLRDDNLVALVQALKTKGFGAGETLARYERMLESRNQT